jgi:hypothetical protein
MTPQEASDRLVGALKAIDGVRVFALGESVSPPCAVVGVPRLAWETYSRDVTSASFPVYLIVALDDRAVPRLLELAPKVAAVIEVVTDGSVDAAEPGVYPVGDLPAYLFTAEFPLT